MILLITVNWHIKKTLHSLYTTDTATPFSQEINSITSNGTENILTKRLLQELIGTILPGMSPIKIKLLSSIPDGFS